MDPCQLKTIGNFRRIPGTKMLRSERPDEISQKDLDTLCRLPVLSIYDMRSLEGYKKKSGRKLARSVFQPVVVTPQEEKVHFQTVDGNKIRNERELQQGRYHFFFDLDSHACKEARKEEAPFLYRIGTSVADFLKKYLGWMFWAQMMGHFILNYHGALEVQKYTLKKCGPQIRAVLRTMAMTSHIPGLICCFHGKDRTGLIACLLMGLAGVDRETIVNHYYKTEEFLKTCRVGFWTNLKKKRSLRSALLRSMHVTKVEKETMTDLLNYIEESHGSVAGYLASIGFDQGEQEDLRRKICTGEY